MATMSAITPIAPTATPTPMPALAPEERPPLGSEFEGEDGEVEV